MLGVSNRTCPHRDAPKNVNMGVGRLPQMLMHLTVLYTSIQSASRPTACSPPDKSGRHHADMCQG